MSNPFQGIGNTVRVIVHRVDTPFVAGALMADMTDAVENRVAQVDIGRGHIDSGAQHMRPVREFSGTHTAKQVETFSCRAIAIRAVCAWFSQCAAQFPDFISSLAVYICFSLCNQIFGKFVQLIKVIRGVVKMFFPVEAQPAN